MAIRTGGGGLKYQLPSQAQIQAQQAAAAASAGGSASASAYGANRRYAGLKMQLRADAFQSGLDRQFRAQQAFFQREHEAGGQLEAQRAALERQQAGFDQQTALQQAQFGQQTAIQQAGQQFTADQAALDRQFTKERDQARIDEERRIRGDTPEQRQFERDQYFRIEDDIRKGTLVLSPADQRELARLDEGLNDASKLDLQGQAEYVKQYERRKSAILQRAKPPGPTATERAQQGTTYFDPQTGGFENKFAPGRIAGRVNEKDEFVPIVEQQDNQEAIVKRARELMTEADPTTNAPKYTSFDEAYIAAEKEQAFVDSRSGKQQVGVAGGPPAQGIGGGAGGVGGALGGQLPAPAVSPVTTAPAGTEQASRLEAMRNELEGAKQRFRQSVLGNGRSAGGQQQTITDVSTAEQNLGALPTPMTKEEYDVIPPGALYLNSAGKMMRKKK